VASLNKVSIDAPDETLSLGAHGRMDVVTLGGFTLKRGIHEPGWNWSVDVKPIVGTDSCQARHAGICVSGQMTVRADDGTEVTFGPGDVFVMEPGHVGWTVGSVPCVLLEMAAAEVTLA
jgi:EutQ-like cupin domain